MGVRQLFAKQVQVRKRLGRQFRDFHRFRRSPGRAVRGRSHDQQRDTHFVDGRQLIGLLEQSRQYDVSKHIHRVQGEKRPANRCLS